MLSSFIIRLRNGMLACCIVACGLAAHSEYGYRVKLVNEHPDAPNNELKEATCLGWPVKYKVDLLGEDGRVYVRVEGKSVRGVRGLRRSLPWALMDGEQFDVTIWNVLIWTLILMGTLSFSMTSIAVGWKSTKFSMLHIVLIMTFSVVLLCVSNGESLGITHVPIAYGATCCLVELIRGLSLMWYCFRTATNS